MYEQIISCKHPTNNKRSGEEWESEVSWAMNECLHMYIHACVHVNKKGRRRKWIGGCIL